MVSCENFFQLAQANDTQSTLQATATETVAYRTGRDIMSAHGMKTKATANRATVRVYPVPVGFWYGSNIKTPRLVGDGLRMLEIRSPDLVQKICGWAEMLRRLVLSVIRLNLSMPDDETRPNEPASRTIQGIERSEH